MRGGVFQVEQLNSLFYVLTRNSNKNQNWGVTENLIQKLQEQSKKWFLVLLSETPLPNFILTANNVNQIIENKKWKVSNGNYKTTTLSLSDNYKFSSINDLRNKINNLYKTAQIANSDLRGDKLYLQKARTILPYLVRQAKAGQPIFYSDLAQETGISNPRNLNYPLGAIGNALKKISKTTEQDIPQIQCLVISKNTKLPGEGIGWFINEADYKKLTKNQKQKIVNRVLDHIYAFQQWECVLQQFQLKPLTIDIKHSVEKGQNIKGGGGESKFHLEFKNFIANNPTAIGLSEKIGVGKTEHRLISEDVIDVVFTHKNTIIGVEVKSRISNFDDIYRGIFQCIKYKHLIEAEQKIENKQPDSRVILALEGQLPEELIAVKNILGIEVIEKINAI